MGRRRCGRVSEAAGIRHTLARLDAGPARLRHNRPYADALTVVFVEVKTRLPDSAAAPEDAVDAVKIRNLCVAADNYVKMHEVDEELRFDIITVVGTKGCEPRIEHIEDAFNPLLII